MSYLLDLDKVYVACYSSAAGFAMGFVCAAYLFLSLYHR